MEGEGDAGTEPDGMGDVLRGGRDAGMGPEGTGRLLAEQRGAGWLGGWQRGGGECYWGRFWRLEGKMELGWGLSGQVRCWEGGGALGWEGQDSWDGTRRDGRGVGEELLRGREAGAGW